MTTPPADAPTTAMPPLTAYLRLESRDPPQNRARFGTLRYQPSRWEGMTLRRTWGRMGTPGRSRVVVNAPPDNTPVSLLSGRAQPGS